MVKILNFDELYEKYKNGNATDEECEYVEAEIAKARRLAAIIDEQDGKRVIEPAKEEQVKKSVLGFMRHTKRRVALIATISLILLIAIGIGSFYGFAAIKASNRSVCDRDEAIELVKKWMHNTHEGIDLNDIRVIEVDTDLALHHGFSKVFFEYDVEIEYKGEEYEFWINSASGEIRLVDRD